MRVAGRGWRVASGTPLASKTRHSPHQRRGENAHRLQVGKSPSRSTTYGRRSRSEKTERPEGSYTATLMDGGVDLVGRKVLEEAGEVLMAAKDHSTGTADNRRVAEEAGDLIYHLLVLLAERGIPLGEVLDVLNERAR